MLALRILLAAIGVKALARVLRRGREAVVGRQLSRSERLEHRAVAGVLLAFTVFLSYLITDFGGLLYGAILIGVGAMGLFAASGVVEGLSDTEPQPSSGPSRNDPCPCGSGKRFKYCHGVESAA